MGLGKSVKGLVNLGLVRLVNRVLEKRVLVGFRVGPIRILW